LPEADGPIKAVRVPGVKEREMLCKMGVRGGSESPGGGGFTAWRDNGTSRKWSVGRFVLFLLVLELELCAVDLVISCKSIEDVRRARSPCHLLRRRQRGEGHRGVADAPIFGFLTE
jgi:hypothetical protein